MIAPYTREDACWIVPVALATVVLAVNRLAVPPVCDATGSAPVRT